MENLPVVIEEKAKSSILPHRSPKEHATILALCGTVGVLAAATQNNVEAAISTGVVQSAHSLASAYIFFEAMQKSLSDRADKLQTISSEIVAMFGPVIATTLLNFIVQSIDLTKSGKNPFSAALLTFVLASISSPIWYIRNRINELSQCLDGMEIGLTQEDLDSTCRQSGGVV